MTSINKRLEDLEQAVRPELVNGGIAFIERRAGVYTWTGEGGGNRVLTEAEIDDLQAQGYYTVLLCLDEGQEF